MAEIDAKLHSTLERRETHPLQEAVENICSASATAPFFAESFQCWVSLLEAEKLSEGCIGGNLGLSDSAKYFGVKLSRLLDRPVKMNNFISLMVSKKRLNVYNELSESVEHLEPMISLLQTVVDTLSTSCGEAVDDIRKTSLSIIPLMHHLQDSRQQQLSLEEKQEVCNTVLKKLRLDPDFAQAITDECEYTRDDGKKEWKLEASSKVDPGISKSSVVISDYFFEAFDSLNDIRQRAARISNYAKINLCDSMHIQATKSSDVTNGDIFCTGLACPNRLGDDILARSQDVEEISYDKMYRFAQYITHRILNEGSSLICEHNEEQAATDLIILKEIPFFLIILELSSVSPNRPVDICLRELSLITNDIATRENILFWRCIIRIANRFTHFYPCFQHILRVRRHLLLEAFNRSIEGYASVLVASEDALVVQKILEFVIQAETFEHRFAKSFLSILNNNCANFGGEPCEISSSEICEKEGIRKDKLSTFISVGDNDASFCPNASTATWLQGLAPGGDIPYEIPKTLLTHQKIVECVPDVLSQPIEFRLKRTIHSCSNRCNVLLRISFFIESTVSALKKLCESIEFPTIEPGVKVVSAPSKLIHILTELGEQSYTAFLTSWEQQSLQLPVLTLDQIQKWTPSGLRAAPSFITAFAESLDEVLKIHKQMGDEDKCNQNGVCRLRADRAGMLAEASIGPLLNYCRHAAHMMTDEVGCVFLLNCYCALMSTLSFHECTSRQFSLLESLSKDKENELIAYEIEKLLDLFGFKQFDSALYAPNGKAISEANTKNRTCSKDDLNVQMPKEACKDMPNKEDLKEFFDNFRRTLYKNSITLLYIGQLADTSTRQRAKNAVHIALINAYSRIHSFTSPVYHRDAILPEQISLLLES